MNPTIEINGFVKSVRADVGKGRMVICVECGLEAGLEVRRQLGQLAAEMTHCTLTLKPWQEPLPFIQEFDENAGYMITVEEAEARGLTDDWVQVVDPHTGALEGYVKPLDEPEGTIEDA